MHFILVNRFFWPDESATSLLLTDLAEDLALRGHEVQVVTSRQLYNHAGANLPSFES
jgi:colanic acid biosynthesis glycosyl transferase WcaI